jgi:hypothetical protein
VQEWVRVRVRKRVWWVWFGFELIFGLKNVLLRGGGGDLKMTLTGNDREALLISRAKNWEAVVRITTGGSEPSLHMPDQRTAHEIVDAILLRGHAH